LGGLIPLLIKSLSNVSSANDAAILGVFAVSVTSVRHGHYPSQVEIHKQALATTDNLPVPSGSWQEYYDKKNAKYNMQVAVNLLAMIATFVLVSAGTGSRLSRRITLRQRA
jgi:hypothetical protein